jgi:hypothetical protein
MSVHYVERSDGTEIRLTQKGILAGFKAGDSVEHLKGGNQGKTGTIVGFCSKEIWTRLGGSGGYCTIPSNKAKTHLRKIQP